MQLRSTDCESVIVDRPARRLGSSTRSESLLTDLLVAALGAEALGFAPIGAAWVCLRRCAPGRRQLTSTPSWQQTGDLNSDGAPASSDVDAKPTADGSSRRPADLCSSQRDEPGSASRPTGRTRLIC
jgi:hypothetical protein